MLASARLPGVGVLTGVASQVMVSDLLSCQGGTFRHYNGRTGPGPGAAARVDTLVRVRPSGNRSRSAL
ncbi:hypothetical protein [Mycobacterium ulcerans]|uniref:Uncharacterized protein n=1 Tax=Mycobacterium ulcerans subsp. shinshuense TaxID=1124626 RepID=A0A1B4XZX6_MYCUL|nr:hypothetical protein [Mycobacterium ulcerans]BAV40349.1 hypothetical protein SHTP_1034 [Mycobacterium ulcerans subsp. shinshuense]